MLNLPEKHSNYSPSLLGKKLQLRKSCLFKYKSKFLDHRDSSTNQNHMTKKYCLWKIDCSSRFKVILPLQLQRFQAYRKPKCLILENFFALKFESHKRKTVPLYIHQLLLSTSPNELKR